jgi:hypothetical protein
VCIYACGVLVERAGGDLAGKNLSVKSASSLDDSGGFAFIITDQAEGDGGREIFCRIDCSAKGTEAERTFSEQQRAHWVYLLRNDRERVSFIERSTLRAPTETSTQKPTRLAKDKSLHHHPHLQHHGTKEEEARALQLQEARGGGSDVLSTSHQHHHHHHHHHHENTSEQKKGSQRAKSGQLQRVPSVLDTDISQILELGEAWERNRADSRQSHKEAELGYADIAHATALESKSHRRKRRGGERDAKRVGGGGEFSSFAGSLQLPERSLARVSVETFGSQYTVERTMLCEKGSANFRPEDRGGEQGRRTRRSEQPSSRTTSGPQAAARRPAEHTIIAAESGGRVSSSTYRRVGQRESNTGMGHSAASSLPRNSRGGMRETDASEFAQLESRARHRASDSRRARPAGAAEARDYSVPHSAVGELVFEKPPRRGPSSRRREDSVARTEETILAI